VPLPFRNPAKKTWSTYRLLTWKTDLPVLLR